MAYSSALEPGLRRVVDIRPSVDLWLEGNGSPEEMDVGRGPKKFELAVLRELQRACPFREELYLRVQSGGQGVPLVDPFKQRAFAVASFRKLLFLW